MDHYATARAACLTAAPSVLSKVNDIDSGAGALLPRSDALSRDRAL